MPWALDMALQCLDVTGAVQRWPRPGGWHEQDEFEIEAMEVAWRVHRFYNDPKARAKENPDFLLWVLREIEQPETYEVSYLNRLWMDNN